MKRNMHRILHYRYHLQGYAEEATELFELGLSLENPEQYDGGQTTNWKRSKIRRTA